MPVAYAPPGPGTRSCPGCASTSRGDGPTLCPEHGLEMLALGDDPPMLPFQRRAASRGHG